MNFKKIDPLIKLCNCVFAIRKTGLSFIILSGVLVSNTGYAQQNDNKFGSVPISSPTAASLGKYADFPVNYHTGIPQIGIPIYTVKEGTLSLPISVSYHASGLKVAEPASWVGAGWALNAGGVITRSVMGGADEKGTSSGWVENNGHFSDYGYNKYLYTSSQDWLGFATGVKDGEPDLFFFNFAGYSGKFYFRDDRTPILVPQQDLKISYEYNPTGTNLGNNIQAFTITTPDGDKYFFGNSAGVGSPAPIEVTNSYSSKTEASGGAVISSWYLNKIESADTKFHISLSYQTESYGYFTTSIFPISANSSDGEDTYGYGLVKNIISGVRLSQIDFSNGNVKFIGGDVRTDLSDATVNLTDNVNQYSKTLGSIQVYNGSVDFKNYEFSYDYFSDNDRTPLNGFFYTLYNSVLTTDKHRLRLLSIKEISGDNSTSVPPYKFGYYAGTVPRRLSFGMDHWGYYNGVTNNSTVIPTYKTTYDNQSFTTVSGADRDTHDSMINGCLQRITYPYGGASMFEFEPNDSYISTAGLDTVDLQNFGIYDYGATDITETETFTVVGPGSCTFTCVNSSTNSYPTLRIDDNDTYNWPINAATIVNNVVVPVVFYTVITFPPGIHPVKLSFPNQTITGNGAHVWVRQWQYKTLTSANTPIGGLRIKKITHNDSVTTSGETQSNDIITSYIYTQDGTTTGPSSGVLYSRPVYVQQVRNDMIKNMGYYSYSSNTYVSNSLNPNGCPGISYIKSGGSIRPMATTQGNHIGYTKVKVTQSGNGYSEYTYFADHTNPWPPPLYIDVCTRTVINASNFCDENTPNYPPAPVPFEYLRGELKNEKQFNNNGDLLKEVSYDPQYATAPSIRTPAFIVASRSNGGGQILLATKYELNSYRKTQMTVTQTDYTPGVTGGVVNTSVTYYGSPYHNQATSKTSTNSKGETLKTDTKYAFDFRSSTADAVPDCSSTYYSDTLSCQNTYNSSAKALSDYLTYQSCRTTARSSYVECRKIYMSTTNTNAATVFKAAHDNAKAAADSRLKPVYELQDKYNNPPLEITNWNNSNLLGASFTWFDYASSPSDFIYPSKTQKINLTAPTTSFTAAAVSGTGINANSSYQDESLFKVVDGNVKELTPKTGITTSYIWDYQNNFPIAQVTNAANTDIAYTSFEGDGTGNFNSFTGSITTVSTPDDRMSNMPPTGKKYYNLTSTGTGRLIKSGLVASKDYFVSYWSKNGSYTITGSTVTQGKTINGWTFYQHKVTTSGTSLTISGTGTIDEVRIYPSVAQMTTYTYDPVIGMTSQCDVNNKISYYQYDKLGRLTLIRDQDKNILKKYGYQYGSTAPADYIAQCDAATCSAGDASKKCVNGTCETGQQVVTSTVAQFNGLFTCTFHFLWSDGSISSNIVLTNRTQACELSGY